MMKKRIDSSLVIGYVILGLFVLFVLAGLVYEPYDGNYMNLSDKLATPSFKHFFGCDQYGRDIYVRVQYGLRNSLIIGLSSTFFGGMAGVIIGAVCGYFGGVIDVVIMRIVDVLFAIPSIILALLFVSLFNSNMFNVILALSLAMIPSFTKMIRSEFHVIRKSDYVLASRMYGSSHIRIIFREILPNVYPIIINCMFIAFNNSILAEAGLSYLGVGLQPPAASLGNMISQAQGYLATAPHYIIIVGVIMIVLLIGLGLVSEGGSWHSAYNRRFKN